MAFAHTPYDGVQQPFAIGLEPLALENWIEPDGDLARDLDEKERLFATRGDVVFCALAGTKEAQAEVLALLAAHLPACFPAIYRRDADFMHVAPASRTVALNGERAPLLIASSMVQEDLCLMQRAENGWRLVAASLCFPSGWSLAEKLGANLAAIHAPVPGFHGQMENRITRIFDHLRVEAPVLRFNWSFYGDGRLHRPRDVGDARFGVDAVRAHIRIERQTLRKLPTSGDILFTIRTYSDPIALFAKDVRGRALAASLRAQLLGLSEAQANYKGLTETREALAAVLQKIEEGA